LGADLEIRPGPDHSGLYRAGRHAALAAIERRGQRELDERDQPVERRRPAEVFNLALQIRDAVLNRETVKETVRVRRPVGLRLGRKIEAEIAGQGEGAHPGQRVGQVAKAFPKSKVGDNVVKPGAPAASRPVFAQVTSSAASAIASCSALMNSWYWVPV